MYIDKPLFTLFLRLKNKKIKKYSIRFEANKKTVLVKTVSNSVTNRLLYTVLTISKLNILSNFRGNFCSYFFF